MTLPSSLLQEEVGLPADKYFSIPSDIRKPSIVSCPQALYAFTLVSLHIAMESIRLRDDLLRILPELDRRVLPEEKRPYLKYALDRMKETALDLFESRKAMALRKTEHWKRELRLTTSRPIFFDGSRYGDSYVEAAMGLANGIVFAVCRMTPEQAAKTDDIAPFLPQMCAPNEFTALEDRIRRTTKLIEMIVSEWPAVDTFQSLCVEEFLGTVDRLGISLPDGQTWIEYITTRDPEAPSSDEAAPGSSDGAATPAGLVEPRSEFVSAPVGEAGAVDATTTQETPDKGKAKQERVCRKLLPFEGVPCADVEILVAIEGLVMTHGGKRRAFTWETLNLDKSKQAKSLLKQLADSPHHQVVCEDGKKQCDARRKQLTVLNGRISENTGLSNLLSTTSTTVTKSNAKSIAFGLWKPDGENTPKQWQTGLDMGRDIQGAKVTGPGLYDKADRVAPKILEQAERPIDEIDTDNP